MSIRKVVLITGGGSGIGAATAQAAADRGWLPVVVGRRASALEEVAASCGAAVRAIDLSEPDAPDALVRSVLDEFGRLDGVVANAGVMSVGTVLQTEPADWDRTMATNLTSVFRLVRASLPPLLESRGAIVGVSSIAALRSPGGAAAYAVSKAAMISLLQSVARDFAADGIRSNVVCPGWVRTEMADAEMAEFGASAGLDVAQAYAAVTELVPQQRPGDPAEIAAAIVWLLGDESTYVNGSVLVVDGGTVLVDPGTVGFDYRLSRRPPAQ